LKNNRIYSREYILRNRIIYRQIFEQNCACPYSQHKISISSSLHSRCFRQSQSVRAGVFVFCFANCDVAHWQHCDWSIGDPLVLLARACTKRDRLLPHPRACAKTWTMDDYYLQPKVKTLKPAHFCSCTLLSFIVYFVVY
jgi:hypothetical protein